MTELFKLHFYTMSDTEEIVKALLNEVKERVSKDQVFDQEDDYGYTKSEHFTSEIFKIEIGNIPTRYGYSKYLTFIYFC